MRKTYLRPMTVVLNISTAGMVAVSGNFTEGNTTTVDVHNDETINGGNAWSRHKRSDIWEDEEEEEVNL